MNELKQNEKTPDFKEGDRVYFEREKNDTGTVEKVVVAEIHYRVKWDNGEDNELYASGQLTKVG